MERGPTRRLSSEASRARGTAPPAPTLAWLLDALAASRVVEIAPMPGSSTSALHRVTVAFAGGEEASIVLRRYVVADVLEESPDIVSQEITALRLAVAAAVPTPNLLAADPEGRWADAPAVVMSWLHGKPRWEAKDRQRFLNDLADAMTAVADVDIPPEVSVRSIRGYTQDSYDPPRWSTRPEIWRRAVEIFHRPVPTSDPCFVHRDFHPGNVLWAGSQLSGVVDWQSAGIGPASIDPGHCRLNMLYYNPEMADQLRITWEQRAQRTFDPWGDVAAIIGVLDSMRNAKNPSQSRLAIEDTLARAVAEVSA